MMNIIVDNFLSHDVQKDSYLFLYIETVKVTQRSMIMELVTGIYKCVDWYAKRFISNLFMTIQ